MTHSYRTSDNFGTELFGNAVLVFILSKSTLVLFLPGLVEDAKNL